MKELNWGQRLEQTLQKRIQAMANMCLGIIAQVINNQGNQIKTNNILFLEEVITEVEAVAPGIGKEQ